MPKVFTKEKRLAIREQLQTAGLELFGRHGLYRTTVDMLVNASMIAKGSFYSFYPSKEYLYLDCLETVRDRIMQEHTLPLLSAADVPDVAIRKLLEKTIDLPRTFPILEDLWMHRTQSALRASIEQSGYSLPQALSVGHDWAMITSHWKQRGYSFDINPRQLHEMDQALLLLAVQRDFMHLRQGIELIIEMVSVGSAGFISSRQ